MLPDNLVSVYQQYKKDTNAVASWLASTAKSCGYPPDLLFGGSSQAHGPERSKRLKGRARKEAKAAASQPQRSSSSSSHPAHTIAIKDFIPLAEFVVAPCKPVVSVPRAFSNTLNRVIATRSGFGSRLAELGNKTDESADAKHSYFVGVLEKVREVLEPRISNSCHNSANLPPPSDPVGEVGGKFAGLSVDEPSEEFLNAPDIERSAPITKDNATYVAEPQLELEEVLFAYSLLMNDLAKIRARIEWIWTNYRDGRFELVAAAISTNTACDLARNLMEDVSPTFKVHGGASKIAQRFYFKECIEKGFSSNDITSSGTGQFNYETYDVGNDTYMITFLNLENWLIKLNKPDAQPNDVPLYPHGVLGDYDPTRDWVSMPNHEKLQQDKILLMELFNELVTIVRCNPRYPVHDELIRGFQELDQTKEIPMYLAFAAQVCVDIHHSLRGRVLSAYETCISHMELIHEDIELYLDFCVKRKGKSGDAFGDEKVSGFGQYIKALQDDHLHEIKVDLLTRLGVKCVTPLHQILRQSPVISGLLLYHLRAAIYEFGMKIANKWGSIKAQVHLYNALRQENILSQKQVAAESWEDLELVLAILGEESFFVGGELPKNPQDRVKNFCLQTGISAALFSCDNFKHNRTFHSERITSKGPPRFIKKHRAPVSEMFFDRYVRNTGQVDWTPAHVDSIISRSLHVDSILSRDTKEEEEPEEDNTLLLDDILDPEKLREQRKRKRVDKTGPPADSAGSFKQTKVAMGARMAPDRLIKSLVYALQAESLTLAFPYLTLHRTAWAILRAIREACDPELVNRFGNDYIKKESHLVGMVLWILVLLRDGNDRVLVGASKAINRQLRQGEGAKAIQRLQSRGFKVVRPQRETSTFPLSAQEDSR